MKQVSFHDDEALAEAYASRWVAWPKDWLPPAGDIVFPSKAIAGMKMWEGGRWKKI